jgi:hypothetical protein
VSQPLLSPSEGSSSAFFRISVSKTVGDVEICDLFPGDDAGAKINACIAALPANGGMADARGFKGEQFLGAVVTLDKPVILWLGASTFTSNMSDPGISSGAFKITSDGGQIWGVGKRLTRITQANNRNIQNLIYSGAQKHIVVRDLTTDGNESHQTITAPRPNFYTCWRSRAGAEDLNAIDIYQTACGNRAIDFRGTTDAKILRGYECVNSGKSFPGASTSNGGNCISIDDDGKTHSTDFLVDGVYVENFGDTGIGTPSTKRGKIVNSTVRCASDVGKVPSDIESGIGGSAMEDVTIAANKIGACKAIGIGAGGTDQNASLMSRNVTIIDNELVGTPAIPTNVEALDNTLGNTAVAYNFKVLHNRLVNGSIDVAHQVDGLISYNEIQDPDSSLNRGIRVADETVGTTVRLKLVGNVIRQSSGVLSFGIDVQASVNPKSVSQHGNRCFGAIATCVKMPRGRF